MNKAFLREPEPDGRAYCPWCQSLGEAVGRETNNCIACRRMFATSLATMVGSVRFPIAKLLILTCTTEPY